jgi:hypothetical protein
MTTYKETEPVLKVLKKAPSILRKLINDIPPELHKQERIKGKWSIHAHAVHIVIAQDMIIQRMERFLNEEHPVFIPYFPDKEKPESDLMDINLDDMLKQFPVNRGKLLSLCENESEEFWSKQSSHPEYHLYTPFIMLRHIMMHDQLHMYRIEELWLTKDEYLNV